MTDASFLRVSVAAVLLLLLGGTVPSAHAQSMGASPLKRSLPPDTAITKTDRVTVKGEEVPYEVTTGTQPVYGDDDTAVASLHYTYYRRSDVDDRSGRPLMISFNGGPGSGSLWMHLGYTSPKHLLISDEGYPVQPYGVEDNNQSIIDVADIVYVNPVNTGFSRVIDDDTDAEQFFGVNADVDYLADWIDTFISRHGRWRSPKYLIGESYGTTRVAGLAGELQNSHWTYLNGVILVSPTGLGMEPAGPSPRSEALKLPYYAATAWYHEQLPDALQSRDLQALLSEVEDYTIEEYIPAVTRGGFVEDARRQAVAQQVARYSGLSEPFVLDHNLAVPADAFWKELLQDEGRTVGRLDSRYEGIDVTNAGSEYDYPAELTAWNHAFTPAINHYLRDDLGFTTDLQYNTFGNVYPWDETENNTGAQLREAMAQNPYLHVMVQSGYYDGATDYFSAKYVMWNLGTRETMRDRLRFEGYRSGHMMYLRSEDLATSNEDIRTFIEESIPDEGTPARYGRNR
ncbi:carboxypeptidase C (cathepsin A) [Salinibacter ruber]|jgi:Carboxypeptidase C (cathepsin A)|uniref:S10 family peptidase n=1 Tax=Salinibacter ruber TaxID=146919 RepID=UPI0021674107|nr:carboxypeptidase [Salinibacter ruber]MCS4138199.1 carboxypeptidase C (cathepsin A) [Salinibacter ruber]